VTRIVVVYFSPVPLCTYIRTEPRIVHTLRTYLHPRDIGRTCEADTECWPGRIIWFACRLRLCPVRGSPQAWRWHAATQDTENSSNRSSSNSAASSRLLPEEPACQASRAEGHSGPPWAGFESADTKVERAYGWVIGESRTHDRLPLTIVLPVTRSRRREQLGMVDLDTFYLTAD
jgi:hypothetical protein